MEEYSKKEIEEIRQVLNTKFFKNTGYFCDELVIRLEKTNDKDNLSYAYEASCALSEDNKKKSHNIIVQFANKVEAEGIALEIAQKTWRVFDKTNDSQLWRNFHPEIYGERLYKIRENGKEILK